MQTQFKFQRYELKYYLSDEIYAEIKRMIRPYMELDPHLQGRESGRYLVRSLYLDTGDLKFYREKLAGMHRRRKFRVRAYDEDRSAIFLEIKGRLGELVYKERAAVPYEDVGQIIDPYGGYVPNGKLNGTALKALSSFLFFVPSLQLRPTVLVAYDREAYAGMYDQSIRLTVDHSLRCIQGPDANLFGGNRNWHYVQTRPILELKFNQSLPLFFRQMIQRLNLRVQSISKYSLCLEKCLSYGLQ